MATTAAVLLLLWIAVPAAAQTDAVLVNYFDHATLGSDQVVRIINSGQQGAPLDVNSGTICADIYVFDKDQEMAECCACKVPANSNLRLSLNTQLLQRPITGTAIDAGSIFIVGDQFPGCNETAPRPTPGLLANKMQLQLVDPQGTPTLVATESNFAPSNLSAQQKQFLGQACAFVQFLGNRLRGKCICSNLPGA